MKTQKYSLNQHSIETFMSWVQSGEIAIPEIQRPFVWSSKKVRDLMDSLYEGYPVGYVIAWRNPNVKLKDGSLSEGKKVLIDGQQRITALRAAILGEYVIDKDYKKIRIKIAFNPIDEKFDVQTPIIAKDTKWIKDISEIFNGTKNQFELTNDYLSSNPDLDTNKVIASLGNLYDLTKKQIGLIELTSDLDIETVTEIFIRINSKGVVLSQADFAMSKIAADERYGGNQLRKAIDYFCHLAIAPEFHSFIRDNDLDFSGSEYFTKMSWLKDENCDIYDPTYNDMLRVAFTSEFGRGKLSNLVSLLSGRDFETRTFEESIAEESFTSLRKGVMNFMSKTHFQRFVMIVKSAGFIESKMIRSQNVLNFAYVLYLKLRSQNVNDSLIEKYVRRWLVLSILTRRYSGSPESQFDLDIRRINSMSFEDYLNDVERSELSDGYWSAGLVQNLNSSVSNSPFFNVFLASQVKNNDKGFLSRDITVSDLLAHRGDIHHIFPRNYLKTNGLPKGQYNQIANYVLTQQEINIKLGSKSPKEYFNQLFEQVATGDFRYGGIDSEDELRRNLEINCIPESALNGEIDVYESFLEERRVMMAKKIKEYYFSL